MKSEYYKDLIHGLVAYAPSRTTAWMLIRNACIEIPTMDKIIRIDKSNNKPVPHS